MAFTSFDGPILSGTTRYGTGATGVNTGSVILAQSAAIPATAGATTIGVLPAGSEILEFDVDVPTQFNSATTLTIGDGTTANKYLTSITITGGSATDNRIARATVDGATVTSAISNIGTAPLAIVATTGGSATAGAARITVRYVQKTSSGSARPSTP